MRTYVADYGQRLTWKGGAPVRASRYANLAVATSTVERTDAIRGVLDASLFTDRAGAACGDTRDRDIPGMSLNAARALLTHPTQPARYACVSDVGLYEASGGGGYDTHSGNAFDTARNFDNMLRSLLAIIDTPREQTDQAVARRHAHHPQHRVRAHALVAGRRRRPQPPSLRLRHRVHRRDRDRRREGHLRRDRPRRRRDHRRDPAENRIGALLSLGIWPFAPEAFAVSDVTGATSSRRP